VSSHSYNYTHPAAAQLLDDAVMRDGLADQLSRGCHPRDGHHRGAQNPSQRVQLLQLRVLRLGLLQDGDVGVGVLPEV
jgi:hypothetical protein